MRFLTLMFLLAAPISAFAQTTESSTALGVKTMARQVAKTDYNCPDFRTHAEAQAFYVRAGGPLIDPHRLDGDNDGDACEALP